jgi:phage terminase large subunit-like protein
MKTGIKDLDQYCDDIASGKIPACDWVRRAVDRHHSDLAKQKTPGFPYYFEPKAALHFFEFCEDQCVQYEGVFNGKPLILEPWQKFVFGSIFGWLKTERFQGFPVRRFREAIIEIPKKQGKSFIGAVIALYGIWWDQMPGAQVYGLARNQQHALKLSYRAAKSMVPKNEQMMQQFKINEGAANMGIYNNEANSFFQPLTSKPESTDGLNIHMAINDETKDWDDFEMYNIVKDGTISMYNSLIVNITTAGYDKNSLGADRRTYLTRILNGTQQDEATYGIIYTIDKEDMDRWDQPDIWAKAMPNFNVSVFREALESKIPACQASVSQKNSFLVKHLNVWMSSEEGFIASEKWDKCAHTRHRGIMADIEAALEPYRGRRAWAGLDMGLIDDFASLVVVVDPDEDGIYPVIPFFWIPEDTMELRKNADTVRGFVSEGFVKATPGDVTDYAFIQKTIQDVASLLRLDDLCYDRYKLDQMIQGLQEDGMEVTPVGQGYVSMSPAIDELEKLVLSTRLDHGGNPVLRWMNGNVVITKDPAGNRKFAKDKAPDKIDGMVALAMALSKSRLEAGQQNGFPDEYEIRGFSL